VRKDLHPYRDELVISSKADLVGFSDPRAFSRAFKRWTGSSPSVVRASKSSLPR
jgi:AraC-like DNA-binding protein